MTEAIVSVLGAAVLGVCGWAFNIHSEVKVQKQSNEDLRELINSKFDAVKELSQQIKEAMDDKFDAQSHRLERIERSMNGHLMKN